MIGFQLIGLEEFRRQLSHLPEDLAQEAANIVHAAATQVGQDTEANYPSRTGNLKRGVHVDIADGKAVARAVVRSLAPHAHLFERGTKQPRKTKSGANRGVMPEGPEAERLIPRAIRARARMTQDLVGVLRDLGFEVDLTR